MRNKLLKCVPLLDSFEETMEKQFSTPAETVDFINQGEEIKKQVNARVGESTEGFISELLKKPLDSDTILVLLNVLYFHYKWKEKLRPASRCEFSVDGVSKKNVAFMEQTNCFK